jgi:phosphatidylglycerol---prolipoprotein diacylglyceryl transferase
VFPVFLHIGPLIVPAYGVLCAAGVLIALAVLLGTSRMLGLNPNHLWNLSIVGLFASLVGSRVLLVALNWTVVRSHPAWLLSLAMVHHPLLACAGAVFAALAGILYAHRLKLPPWDTADALTPPLVLGFASEQIGALLAGSGFGTETNLPWAVVYTHPLAARWSGAPLFVPLHPVQAYAAIWLLAIAGCLLIWMRHRRQPGDISGIALMAVGTAIFVTEFWRDPEGRGSMLQGALDAPQVFAIVLVVGGTLVLRERRSRQSNRKQTSAQGRIGDEVPHA